MILIDGKATSAAIRNEITAEVASIKSKCERVPGLAVILVGDDPASQVYVRNKEKSCQEVGFFSDPHHLPATTTQQELLVLIDRLNADKRIDGILLQLPLPKELDSQLCLSRIAPEKDVDGFHPVNMGKLVLGLPGLRSCTPAGVMELLKRYNLNPSGKHAVVIGRSNIVGKPLAAMLTAPGPYANATVTVCHSGTKNLAAICKTADFIFLALGKPKFLTSDMVKEGVVVLDIGINRTETGLCGDCDFESVSKKARAISPVPGGVGPMTIAKLLANTLCSFKEREHV